MNKILISLVAVVGLLVAGENSVKEVKICDAKGSFLINGGMVLTNMREMNCSSYQGNMPSLTNESFHKLYETGWRYVGSYRGLIEFEDKPKVPNSKETETTYLIFEK